MVEVAELTSEDTLKLPGEIAAHFRPSDRFVVWVEGDTLYLKRITPTSLTKIVAEAPEGNPPSTEELDEIVHQVRRQRKAG